MKEVVRFLRKIVTSISPVLSNKIMYRVKMKKKLNLKNPKTFNEKINWLKIYDYPYNETVIKCADKYLVRDYMTERGYSDYLVNLIGVWDSPDVINFNELPDKFVLKCNHGSKYNIICFDKSKLDINNVVKKLNDWMKEDFGKVSCEYHYSKIPKKIICEEYLDNDLKDLQVWCSYGKILFIVYINSPHGINEKKTFDENWNEVDFVTSLPIIKDKVKKPEKLDDIILMAKDISKEFVFLRLDFYILNNNIVKFSEMTFSPASGFIQWKPSKYDKIVGNTIDLSKKTY